MNLSPFMSFRRAEYKFKKTFVLHRVTIWASNSTPRYKPNRNEKTCPHKDLYKNVHSSIFYNSQKVETTKCPSTAEWIKKMWYNGILFSQKRNEVYATTWMNLKNTKLNKKVSHKRSYTIPSTWNVWNRPIHRGKK